MNLKPKSKAYLINLLRREFDSINFNDYPACDIQSERILKVCTQLGFNETAEEISNDILSIKN